MKKFPGLRHSFRVSLFLSTLVAAVASSQALLVTDAKADSAEKAKVAVGGFEGAKSDEVRAAFIEALKKDGSYEITDAEDIKPSAKGKTVTEAAAGLGVNVIITGKVSKGFGLKLKVLNGADGKVLDDAEIKGGALPKLKTAIEKSGASSVADGIGKAKGKKKEEPKKEEAKKPEEAAKPEEEKPAEEASASVSTSDNSKGLSPLDITAGLQPMHRTFTFHDTLADIYGPKSGYYQLLKYELPLGPALFIDLNWFPASHFTSGPAEWIGLTGGFQKGFATQSVYGEGTKDQKTLKTDEQSFYFGGRFRLPIGEHMLGATGTYGQHSFILSGDEGPYPLIPDVKYGYVKVGVDGMFRFGDFLAGARIGKRFVMSTGDLKRVWFSNVKAQSLEAGVTVGYRLVSMLDLVVGFDWLRYAFDFNPVPKRPSYVAGGAVDEYLSGNIGFRFHMPGAGEAQE